MILNTEKERIDSGYFLHQAEVKKKKDKKDERRIEDDKSASMDLGAMFEMDSFESESNFPPIAVMRISSSHKERKEVKKIYFIHVLKDKTYVSIIKIR